MKKNLFEKYNIKYIDVNHDKHTVSTSRCWVDLFGRTHQIDVEIRDDISGTTQKYDYRTDFEKLFVK